MDSEIGAIMREQNKARRMVWELDLMPNKVGMMADDMIASSAVDAVRETVDDWMEECNQ